MKEHVPEGSRRAWTVSPDRGLRGRLTTAAAVAAVGLLLVGLGIAGAALIRGLFPAPGPEPVESVPRLGPPTPTPVACQAVARLAVDQRCSLDARPSDQIQGRVTTKSTTPATPAPTTSAASPAASRRAHFFAPGVPTRSVTSTGGGHRMRPAPAFEARGGTLASLGQ